MLPPTAPLQFPALSALASGPYSYIYTPNHWRDRGEPGMKLTDYPAPDGAWDWRTCPAKDWTPELAGIPPNRYQK